MEFPKYIDYKLNNNNEINPPLSISSIKHILNESKIKNMDEFNKNYIIEKELINNEEFKLCIYFNKNENKKYLVKEYRENFIKLIKNKRILIDTERNNILKCNKKFIIKLVDYFQSKYKIFFIFEYCDKTLKDILKYKKNLTIKEIQLILIQLNEAIKYLNYKEINDLIISPENIVINDLNIYSLKLLNLFPYYKLKYILSKESIVLNSFDYLSPEYPKEYNKGISNNNNDKDEYDINLYTKSLLWNIGIIIYELYFGELPYKKENNNIKLYVKNSGDKLFDDLLTSLLFINLENKIKWNDYYNHQFFSNIEINYLNKILYEKEFKENIQELDLISEGIDEDNIKNLLKINFKYLLKLNLSHNNIKDISFLKEKSFQNLKFIILENNKIKNLDILKNNILEELEIFLLYSNLINDLSSFKNKNFVNLNYLSLANNKIQNISYLTEAKLYHLEVLNLSNNIISDINCLIDLKTPELKELYLNGNKIIDIKSLENIHFSNLEILNLNNNNIDNINIFLNVKFQKTIKELYLLNNPIIYFNSLNLCYFQSLEKICLPLDNFNFKILSIKLRLYGYEFENGDNINNVISIIYIPFELYQSYLQDMSNLNMFNYKNSFKIITNKNTDISKLNIYFCENILKLNTKLVSIYEDNKGINLSLHNFKIFTYYTNENLINQEIRKSTLFLIKEYKNKHKITNKYNKILNFLKLTIQI